MRFDEILTNVQEDIMELLSEHLSISADIIAKDKVLLPMMMILRDDPAENQIVGLQPGSGEDDVDKAYEFAVRKLKAMDFHYAVFSYSTQIVLDSGARTDAVKDVVIAADGLEVTFFAPFTLSGFLKKKVDYGKLILGGVAEKIFAQME